MRHELIKLVDGERTSQLRDVLAVHALDVEDRVARGLCVTDLRPVGSGGTFRYHENQSHFRVGDWLMLGRGKPIGQRIGLGQLVILRACYPERHSLTLYPVNMTAFQGIGTFTLDASVENCNSQRLRKAINLAYDTRPDLSQMLEGTLPLQIEQAPRWASHTLEHRLRTINLTNAQKLAFLDSMASRVKLIQGPPGSGKSVLLALIVSELSRHGLRVLVTASTHRAIDNVLRELAQLDCPGIFKVAPTPDPRLDARIRQVDYRNAGTIVPVRQAVVGATPYLAYEMAAAGTQFDLVAFDEAGQVPLPHALAAMLCGQRFILVGDHKQLPPVLRCQNHSLSMSIFERLHDLYGQLSTMLDVTHRLNVGLNEFPSREFYGGTLTPSAEAAGRKAVFAHRGELAEIIARNESITFLQLDHKDCQQQSLPEAQIVARLAAELLTVHCVLPRQMAIIAPHRAQNRAIFDCLRRELQSQPVLRAAVGNELTVDTVERIQGQQREIIIFSLGVSDEEFVRSEASFIFSPHRLNVAITRARRRLFVVGSKHFFRARLYDEVRLANANFYKRFRRFLRPHTIDVTRCNQERSTDMTKFERAKRMTQQAEELLRKRLQAEQDALVEHLCEQDDAYRHLQAQDRKLRSELHFIRVSVSRKLFSIRRREKALEKILQAKIAEEQREKDKAEQHALVLAQLQQVRDSKSLQAREQHRAAG